MGDRSYVRLEVLASQKEKAEEIIEERYAGSSEDYESEDDLHTFCFEEVNGGDLPFLEELTAAGIAFDSSWDAGGDYGPGTDSCRFTPEGGAVTLRVMDDEINPDIYTLLKNIDDPIALRQSILDHKKKTTTLSWDDQEEYGQRYQARQLISS